MLVFGCIFFLEVIISILIQNFPLLQIKTFIINQLKTFFIQPADFFEIRSFS